MEKEGEVGGGGPRSALNTNLKNLDFILRTVRNQAGRIMIIVAFNSSISRLYLLVTADLPAFPAAFFSSYRQR